MASPIVLIPHLFWLAGAIIFLERTIHSPLVHHLDPTQGGVLTATSPENTFLEVVLVFEPPLKLHF